MLTRSMAVMSTCWNAPPSREQWKGECAFDWQAVSQATECGMCAEAREKSDWGRLWQIDCTYWAIRVKLIGWLSLRWTVISQGVPLWKPFKCELIDVIVLKMTELLWYYRTHLAFPLWVNKEPNGNWQNVAIQREKTAGRENDKMKKEATAGWRNYTVHVCVHVSVCVYSMRVHIWAAKRWGHGNLNASVFWSVD